MQLPRDLVGQHDALVVRRRRLVVASVRSLLLLPLVVLVVLLGGSSIDTFHFWGIFRQLFRLPLGPFPPMNWERSYSGENGPKSPKWEV